MILQVQYSPHYLLPTDSLTIYHGFQISWYFFVINALLSYESRNGTQSIMSVFV